MPRFSLPLDTPDAQTLRQWSEGQGRMAERSQIVLLSAQALGAEEIARRLGVALPTVYKWRKRFSQRGLAGLRDLPRPGQPRRLSDAQRDFLVRHTTDRLAPGHGHWTIRSLAKTLGVTQHQVREAWAAANLRPHVLRRVQLDKALSLTGGQPVPMGLYVGPPYCALVLRVEPAEPVEAVVPNLDPLVATRSVADLRPRPDTPHDALRTTFMAADSKHSDTEARDRELREELLGFLCETSRRVGAGRLHIVLSVDALGPRQRRRVEGSMASEPQLHTLGTNEAWLVVVDRWLRQQHERHPAVVRDLRSALAQHARDHADGRGATFAWFENRPAPQPASRCDHHHGVPG